MSIIARVSSQHPGGIRWRELSLERRDGGQIVLVEELISSINHDPKAKSCTVRRADLEPAEPNLHITPCRVCGGGSLGEGRRSRETVYDGELSMLQSVAPQRGLPLEVVFLAASKDAQFGEALIDYLDSTVVPA